MDPVWDWSDGWLLMSIYFACQDSDAELADVVAAADAINHAIPSESELLQACTKLKQCGVIIHDRGKFRIATKFSEELKQVNQAKGGLFQSAEKGLKWLKQTDFSGVSQDSCEITTQQISAAYQTYLKQSGQ